MLWIIRKKKKVINKRNKSLESHLWRIGYWVNRFQAVAEVRKKMMNWIKVLEDLINS